MKAAPSTERGRAAVARVVDAACVLFARQGIRATTLDQVGRASGTGRGQLYLWFADKGDLVAEVVTQQVERVLAAQHPLLATMSSASDVRRWCTVAAQQYAADDPVRCPVGSLVHELAEQDTTATAALAAGLARWRSALAGGLARVHRRGELAPGIAPEAAATALLAAYQGGVLLAAAHRDLDLLRGTLVTVADGLLRPPGGDRSGQPGSAPPRSP